MTGAVTAVSPPVVTLDIAEIVGSFPTYRVALVIARDLSIPVDRGPALAVLVAEEERRIADGIGVTPLADLPEVRCWRDAYRAFGVRKTSYRSSVERLLKGIVRGDGLARVNALVDIYNAISLRYRLPIGADDLDRLALPLAFRYSRPGDSFIALGDGSRTPDPPKPGEVVYADAVKCLCRRWNWYQDDRSAVATSTRHAVLTIQGLEPVSALRVETAAGAMCHLIAEHCGGQASWAVADLATPQVDVDMRG